MAKITAPWTVEQVKALHDYQVRGDFHPYTCPNQGDENKHPEDFGEILLVATMTGWTCTCGYTQKWAHAFSAGEYDEDR